MAVVAIRRRAEALDENAEYTLNEYMAHQSWDRRDYASALAHAQKATELAEGTRHDRGYWGIAFLIASCQLELGMTEEFEVTAKSLADEAELKQYPELEAKAKTIWTNALLQLGHVDEAVETARQAEELLGPVEDHDPGRYETRFLLIASLAESGELEEAWRVALEFADIVSEDVSPSIAGKAYWAIGNAGFMADRIPEAVHYHDLAAKLLSPSNDVNLWGLFNKATAHMRLGANLVEEATLECIERAELALSVTGGSPRDELEISLTRAHWLLLTGDAGEALKRLEEIDQQSHLLPSLTAAEATYLMAMALLELGRTEESLQYALACEQAFTSMGAGARATQALELIDKLRKADE